MESPANDVSDVGKWSTKDFFRKIVELPSTSIVKMRPQGDVLYVYEASSESTKEGNIILDHCFSSELSSVSNSV